MFRDEVLGGQQDEGLCNNLFKSAISTGLINTHLSLGGWP